MFNICLLILMIANLISNFTFAQDKPVSTSWTVIRSQPAQQAGQVTEAVSEAKKASVPKQDPEMLALFALLPEHSVLRERCSRLDYDASSTLGRAYDCKKIAKLLFCAPRIKTEGQKAYCGRDGEPVNGDLFWDHKYHAKSAVEGFGLNPKQAVKEIDYFIETIITLK